MGQSVNPISIRLGVKPKIEKKYKEDIFLREGFNQLSLNNFVEGKNSYLISLQQQIAIKKYLIDYFLKRNVFLNRIWIKSNKKNIEVLVFLIEKTDKSNRALNWSLRLSEKKLKYW